MLFVEVVLNLPLFKSFDYITEKEIPPGCRIVVPFGNKKLVAISIKTKENSEIDAKKLKPITKILDSSPILDSSTINFLDWISDYYFTPKGEVYFNSIPKALREDKEAQIKQNVYWQLTEKGINCTDIGRAKKQFEVIQYMQKNNRIFEDSELTQIGATKAIKESLLSKEFISTFSKNDTKHSQQLFHESKKNYSLTDEQTQVISTVKEHLNTFQVFSLQGVTGSGKTEVYIRLIEAVLQNKKQALLLIPEIGLTPQTVSRFENHFSHANISILHSKLSTQERYKHWMLAKEGIADIIIGTRSAIFTPLKNPGIFIIDESHDLSYKQQDSFRYSAKDSLIKRAHIESCPIVLGTATPTIETIFNVKQNRFKHLELKNRVDSSSPPPVKFIDLKGTKNNNGISAQLIHKIQEHLDNNNQVLLFLNRRGYAPVFMCFSCGWHAGCTNCDTKLVTHQSYNLLKCHLCENKINIPKECPDCKEENIKPLGFGTERIEERLEKCFPNKKIVRIDRESTSKKGAFDEIIKNIQNKNTDIIIGTQMIAKGHHFPNVTLVGILDIDGALFSSDFRSMERLGQLVTQVAGRAGRGEKKGEVILQTMHPDHYLLNHLLKSDYNTFCELVLEERKLCNLPPFHYQALFRAYSKNQHDANSFLENLKNAINHSSEVEALGPIASPVERRVNYYHCQLLLQSSSRKILHNTLKRAISYVSTIKNTQVRWSIDVDPQEML